MFQGAPVESSYVLPTPFHTEASCKEAVAEDLYEFLDTAVENSLEISRLEGFCFEFSGKGTA